MEAAENMPSVAVISAIVVVVVKVMYGHIACDTFYPLHVGQLLLPTGRSSTLFSSHLHMIIIIALYYYW